MFALNKNEAIVKEGSSVPNGIEAVQETMVQPSQQVKR